MTEKVKYAKQKEPRNVNMDGILRPWMRQFRLDKGWTLQDVANMVDSVQKYIGDIENGRRNPSPPLAFKLCQIFEVPMEKFFETYVPVSHSNTKAERAEWVKSL